jgi:hypothetical protein
MLRGVMLTQEQARWEEEAKSAAQHPKEEDPIRIDDDATD